MVLLPCLLLVGVRVPILGTVVDSIAFVGALLLINIPAQIFREPLFRFEEFGANPQGWMGWTVVWDFGCSPRFSSPGRLTSSATGSSHPHLHGSP